MSEMLATVRLVVFPLDSIPEIHAFKVNPTLLRVPTTLVLTSIVTGQNMKVKLSGCAKKTRWFFYREIDESKDES